MSLRVTKINDLLRDLISEAMTTSVSFKEGVLVTLTKVRTTKDLRYSHFSVSVFPESETHYVEETLKHELSHIEKTVHQKLYMKPLPRLAFEVDKTAINADKVEKILKDLFKGYPPLMQRFHKEFHTLTYVIREAKRILLVAHKRPDPDTVGANCAMQEHLKALGKEVSIACYDPYPESLLPLGKKEFLHPESIDIQSYDAILALDSVDRGFHLFASQVKESQVVVLMDHHPDITLSGDVVIIDPEYSSTCELVYLFLRQTEARFTKPLATYLLAGLVFDTGGFKHSKVSPQVMEMASFLMNKGAPLAKISQTIFAHRNIAALRLWGKALEKARLNKENGLLVTAVTQEDIEECQASPEDIYQVTSILSAVPDAKFAMVLSERDPHTVRASLRSMEHHGVDVSAIAHQFGGGGHHLASGFEIPGKIVETSDGFAIV